MKKTFYRSLAVTAATIISTLGTAGIASAQSTGSTQMYQANLSSLNGSGSTGTATVSVTGDQLTVKVHSDGASANLAHAQHIHIGGKNICPTAADNTNKDAVLTTAEGQPAYGDIKVSLTTSGDASATSGLAVDRFPKASATGSVDYNRTFTLPSGVTASDVANGVIVTHGVASLYGDKTKYDGSMKSELDSSLPEEATAPASCGKLTAAPTGGAQTGSGSTAGTEDTALIAAGAASVAAAGALLIYRRRLSER